MQIYNYDAATGRFLGAAHADPDRERPGEWLFPAFSTPLEPPTPGDGLVPVFDRVAGMWTTQALPALVTAAPQPQDSIDAATSAKAQRDFLLRSTDWVALRALERGEQVPDAWKEYRQALRDITGQAGFPHDINWPKVPTV